jgi:hypothetical protein
MPRSLLVLMVFVSLLTTFRSPPVLLLWERGEWITASPRPTHPPVPLLEADLDSDGSMERIVSRDGQITILRNAARLWSTPPEWEVTLVQIADVNQDGQPEVVMAVWRPFKPWPVDAWLPHGGRITGFHDAQNRSCHIILWGWGGTRFRELWAGSAMAEPVLAFFAADWDADGRDELMTVETAYDLPTQGRAVALWKWNGFGFSLMNRWNTGFGRFVLLQDETGIPGVLLDPMNGRFTRRSEHG